MQAPKHTNEVFRIFVGGLSYDVDNHQLKENFQRFSSLKKALVIRDQKTGQSKGYGFVTFSSKAAFDAALRSTVYVHGRPADLHPVLTKGALKDQEQRDVSHKLFIGGISQTVTCEDLHRYFAQFGRIKESRILYDGKTGKSRGFGFVLFEKLADAEVVLSISVHKLKKKQVEIKRFSKEKEDEMEAGLQQLRNLQQQRQCNEDQLSFGPTSFDQEKTKLAKPKRKKAQKVKQDSLESLSTISEKDTPQKFATPHYFDASPPQCLDYQEEKSCMDQGSFQGPSFLASSSKPSFTLSGFFAYSQTFEPFKTPLPFSGDPLRSANSPYGPAAWGRTSTFAGPAWTPAVSRQSRPEPSTYKY